MGCPRGRFAVTRRRRITRGRFDLFAARIHSSMLARTEMAIFAGHKTADASTGRNLRSQGSIRLTSVGEKANRKRPKWTRWQKRASGPGFGRFTLNVNAWASPRRRDFTIQISHRDLATQKSEDEPDIGLAADAPKGRHCRQRPPACNTRHSSNTLTISTGFSTGTM